MILYFRRPGSQEYTPTHLIAATPHASLVSLSHVLARAGEPEPRVPDGAASARAPLADDVLHALVRVRRAVGRRLVVVDAGDAVGRPLRAAARLGARPDRWGFVFFIWG